MKRAPRRKPLALGVDPAQHADAVWRDATREARERSAVATPAPTSGGELRSIVAEPAAEGPSAAAPTPEATPPMRVRAAEPAAAPRRPQPRRQAEPGSAVMPLAVFAAAAWLAAAGALAVTTRLVAAAQREPALLAAALMLALLPAVLMLVLGMALREGLRMAAQARSTRALAEDMVTPAAVAGAQAVGVAEAVRAEVGAATLAVSDGLEKLSRLREALADETRQLHVAAEAADHHTRDLTGRLAVEREALAAVAADVGRRSADSAAAAARHADLAAETLAEGARRLETAEATLAARTADLALAAAEAERAATGAAGALAGGVAELDRSGQAAAGALAGLLASLERERDQVSKAAEALRVDRDDADARAETRHARTDAQVHDLRALVGGAEDAAGDTAETLRRLISETASNIRAFGETARLEHQATEGHARASLASLADHAQAERDRLQVLGREVLSGADDALGAATGAAESRLEALRGQADDLSAAVKARMDELAQAGFDAGRLADQAFDARIAAARKAVEAATETLEAVGLRASERIEQGLGGARAAVDEMQALLGEVDARFAGLPEAARTRADAVRRAVESGLEALTAAAHRAAEETQAVDAAFQDRVRRNYATLGEAVRLMSVMTETAETQARAQAAPPAPPAPSAPPAPPAAIAAPSPQPAPDAPRADLPPPAAPALRPAATPTRMAAAAWAEQRRAPSPPAPTADAVFTNDAPASAEPAPRTRLKLAPTREDEAMRALFEPAPVAASPRAAPQASSPAGDGGWSWRDLLATVDGTPEGDDEELAGRLAGEIADMGVDAQALLPAARLDEAAGAFRSAGQLGARETVRRAAPAAVRRLARRLSADRVLRAEAERVVARGDASAQDAAVQPNGALSSFLASEGGRTWLLAAAALGEAR